MSIETRNRFFFAQVWASFDEYSVFTILFHLVRRLGGNHIFSIFRMCFTLVTIESVGALLPDVLFLESIKVLKEKCSRLLNEIKIKGKTSFL